MDSKVMALINASLASINHGPMNEFEQGKAVAIRAEQLESAQQLGHDGMWDAFEIAEAVRDMRQQVVHVQHAVSTQIRKLTLPDTDAAVIKHASKAIMGTYRVCFSRGDGATMHVDVQAVGVDGAQEVAIERLEALGVVHDTIMYIRAI